MNKYYCNIKNFIFKTKDEIKLNNQGLTSERIYCILGGLIKIRKKKLNISQSGIMIYDGKLMYSCLPNNEIVIND